MLTNPNKYHHDCIAKSDTGVMNATSIQPWKLGSKWPKGVAHICLKQTHKTSECNLTRTCHYCGQSNAHHRSLCPKKFGSVQQVPAHLADEFLEQDVEDVTENALTSSEEIVLR